ncbi:MAG: RnfABCDGE type electron transport complex subunit D [Clostridia bacterium]|nr:RnfABCDGE type electron transport complex subunit D [Clostridia bacterium]
MDKLIVSSSPHITNQNSSTKRIMLDVIISLIPSVICATVFFGHSVITNVLACSFFCYLAETLWWMIANKNFSLKALKDASSSDLSCIVTGVILALNMPAVVNVWGLNLTVGGTVIFSFDTLIVSAIGSLVAVLLVKQLFGGIGKNFANPAATARVFLLLCFATGFTASQSTGLIFQASTGATWLSGGGETTGEAIWRLFVGNVGSSAVGETCVIAILIGYVYLSVRKVIDFRIPLMIVGWSAVFALLFSLVKGYTGVDLLLNTLGHILAGGLLFGAVFMATDYSTSPNTFEGNCVYCFGIALITMLIRFFASYPEGMSFAIVILNIVTPIINKYIYHKPFGYVRAKKEKTERETK